MPYHMIKNPDRDSERLSLFPNLDYRGLHDCVYEFIPDLHLVTSSTYSCGKALLTLLASLFPFMDRTTIEDFPYNMTELVELLPVSITTTTNDSLKLLKLYLSKKSFQTLPCQAAMSFYHDSIVYLTK